MYLRLEPALEGSPFLFFAAQFVLVAAVLVVPTTLMGGTLPLLARFAVLSARRGRRARRRRSTPPTRSAPRRASRWPPTSSSRASASRRPSGWRRPPTSPSGSRRCGSRGRDPPRTPALASKRRRGTRRRRRPASRAARALLLWGTALSGFSAMVYEVAWSRTLAMMLGSSVYAFGMMLLLFLARALDRERALRPDPRLPPPDRRLRRGSGGHRARSGSSGVFVAGELPAALPLALPDRACAPSSMLQLVQLLVTATLVLPAGDPLRRRLPRRHRRDDRVARARSAEASAA